jgi:hypothetical protein
MNSVKRGSANPLGQARASAFEIAISRFDSCRPSQPFRPSAGLPRKSENGPEMPAFRALDFVSRLSNRQSQGVNRRKSPATPANIPVLQRLSAETGFDHDCRLRAAVNFAVISSLRRAYWKPSVWYCLPRVVAWQILPLRLCSAMVRGVGGWMGPVRAAKKGCLPCSRPCAFSSMPVGKPAKGHAPSGRTSVRCQAREG